MCYQSLEDPTWSDPNLILQLHALPIYSCLLSVLPTCKIIQVSGPETLFSPIFLWLTLLSIQDSHQMSFVHKDSY